MHSTTLHHTGEQRGIFVEWSGKRREENLRLCAETASRNELPTIRRRDHKKRMGKPETAVHDLQDKTDYRIEVGRLVNVLGELENKLLHVRRSVRSGRLIQERLRFL